jgi:hypothetical protein
MRFAMIAATGIAIFVSVSALAADYNRIVSSVGRLASQVASNSIQ